MTLCAPIIAEISRWSDQYSDWSQTLSL